MPQHPGHSTAGQTEYVDVKFESLMLDLDTMLSTYRRRLKQLSETEQIESLKEICRAIRSTKLYFHNVLERYGANYEDSARHFVDLAYAAADLSHASSCKQLQRSLTRHAEE